MTDFFQDGTKGRAFSGKLAFERPIGHVQALRHLLHHALRGKTFTLEGPHTIDEPFP